ncbi:hypothetical protein Pmani_036909 [Petrolisthes manimaculis]|uniref:Uncharacterized protein n=1 Tax=Petrolisthes manimaculis TaxID=1843537 RepID=A0AAE1TNY8_9EUCA|nr:hypothetical protein Pmani_036909 [Petrolisthes manimaculis]
MSACSVDVFKRHLDNFLQNRQQKIPNTSPPPCPRTRTSETWLHYNKLKHHIPLYLRQNKVTAALCVAVLAEDVSPKSSQRSRKVSSSKNREILR